MTLQRLRFALKTSSIVFALSLTACGGGGGTLPHGNGPNPPPAASLVEFVAPGSATVVTGACGATCGTQAYANNSLGAVVGSYTDANVVPHGFLRSTNGTVTSFDAPGAGLGAGLDEGTVAYGINTGGVIVGQFQDPSLVFHGFVRQPAGTFTTVNATGAGTGNYQGTLIYNVNTSGATAGVYYDGSNTEHGFVAAAGGATTSFDPSGSAGTMVCEETCLNDTGTVTGFFLDANQVIHGFVRATGGAITQIDAPGAGSAAGSYTGTTAASIAPDGSITGYLIDANGVAHGFVRTPGGTITPFDVPGAGTQANQGTAAFSIDSADSVTGEFIDSNGAMHGFTRSSAGVIATFNAQGAGTQGGQGTRPSTNNAQGAVTGWWIDSTGVNHGVVYTP
jgi:hypothetical protein